jgi:hypothetical protein
MQRLGAWAALASLHVFALAAEPTLVFTVTVGDTLIGLSERVLVAPDAWREVAALNRLARPNRLRPGQALQIPLRLMRWTPANATLVSVSGEVLVDGRAGVAQSTMSEGQTIETGPAGSAVVELADQSRIKLAPSSLVEVLASRRHPTSNAADSASSPSTGLFSGALRLLRGSVEVFATQVLRAKPLEVSTPTAVVGVRGTQYRVNFDEAANRSTRAGVIEGAVRFDLAKAAASGAAVAAGFGAAIDATASAPSVVKLLPAPDLASVPERFDRPLVRFALASESQPVRIQVAADSAFDKIVLDQRVAPGTEVRLAGLDDAQWHLRARRLDGLGIEGYDAVRPFVLKARPEPPAATQPRRASKQTVGAVEFAWAQNLEASSQRLQVARDAAFGDMVADRNAVPGTSVRIEILSPGAYFWRLASVRADGDAGPFGDPLSFELRATPEPPKGGMASDGASLAFSWSGRPQDRQQVELARDANFQTLVASAELTSTEWVLPRPERGGDYFFRYRSVEPDGFVSANSATLKTEVPKDWRPLWLLLPFLFGL